MNPSDPTWSQFVQYIRPGLAAAYEDSAFEQRELAVMVVTAANRVLDKIDHG